MVKRNGFVKPGDEVPKTSEFRRSLKKASPPLENQGDVGDKIPVKDGFAIPMLVDKREPRDAEFDEVKDQVAEAV